MLQPVSRGGAFPPPPTLLSVNRRLLYARKHCLWIPLALPPGVRRARLGDRERLRDCSAPFGSARISLPLSSRSLSDFNAATILSNSSAMLLPMASWRPTR